jgi:capsule biosynthesis phosphatase
MSQIPDVNDKKRIIFDIDKTIAKQKLSDQKYQDLEPLPGAVETLQRLKKEGWYIIISSARNMRTYNHNVGQVNAFQTKIIVDWLTKWEIPFDEFWVKPWATYFVDDSAIQFIDWETFNKDLSERIKGDQI